MEELIEAVNKLNETLETAIFAMQRLSAKLDETNFQWEEFDNELRNN